MADIEIVVRVEGVKETIALIRKVRRALGILYLIRHGWPKWLVWLVCKCFPMKVVDRVIWHYRDREILDEY